MSDRALFAPRASPARWPSTKREVGCRTSLRVRGFCWAACCARAWCSSNSPMPLTKTWNAGAGSEGHPQGTVWGEKDGCCRPHGVGPARPCRHRGLNVRTQEQSSSAVRGGGCDENCCTARMTGARQTAAQLTLHLDRSFLPTEHCSHPRCSPPFGAGPGQPCE